jgi:hypothetical protein
MTKTITAKAFFGLGITSVTDFFKLMSRYQLIRDNGVAYINANKLVYDKKAGLVIFDGLREFFRFADSIKENQVIVISEIPTVLKEITDITPLDYDLQRSFEFNFNPADPKPVLRAVSSKTARAITRLVSYNNLGYHIERVKSTSDLMAAFISMTTQMPFDIRSKLRRAMNKFFQTKKCDTKLVTSYVKQLVSESDTKLKDEVNTFIDLFKAQGESYHKAVRLGGQSKVLAKQFGIDPYAINYFRRMQNSLQIVDVRNKKSNVEIAA